LGAGRITKRCTPDENTSTRDRGAQRRPVTCSRKPKAHCVLREELHDEHLAEHPDQTVTSVSICLFPAQNERSAYNYKLEFHVRGRNQALSAQGYCSREGERLRCGVECDGGGVSLALNGNTAMMYLLDFIRLSSCDDATGEGGESLSAGKDDNVFRLDRVR
jgi:hypothetical protein